MTRRYDGPECPRLGLWVPCGSPWCAACATGNDCPRRVAERLHRAEVRHLDALYDRESLRRVYLLPRAYEHEKVIAHLREPSLDVLAAAEVRRVG